MGQRNYYGLIASLFFMFIGVIIYAANVGWIVKHFPGLISLPGFDKIAHCLLYGTLAMLVGLAWPKQLTLGPWSCHYACSMVFGFAVIEEFSQLFISHRTADFGDLVADLIGVLCTNRLLYKWRQREKGCLSLDR